MAPLKGGYELGFKLTPLVGGPGGELDFSGDFKGGPHPVEEDPLYNMALENRDGGNKMVKAGEYEPAIGRYSEMIMQTRALENETDVVWTEEGHVLVRQLRASAYLNLSLCFLKTEQWTHALNTATRALQGDKDPADAKEDVLAPEKKAKALFRRAQAHSQGSDNFVKAKEDLEAALKHAPEDKAILQELARVERQLTKATKAADKKLAGFLNKRPGNEGLFGDDLRPADGPKAKEFPTEPMKLKDGLWVMPGAEDKEKKEKAAEANPDAVDFAELSREIAEMKESNPEGFADLRDKVHKKLEADIAKQEQDEKETNDKTADAVPEDVAKTEGREEVSNAERKEDKCASAEGTAATEAVTHTEDAGENA